MVNLFLNSPWPSRWQSGTCTAYHRWPMCCTLWHRGNGTRSFKSTPLQLSVFAVFDKSVSFTTNNFNLLKIILLFFSTTSVNAQPSNILFLGRKPLKEAHSPQLFRRLVLDNSSNESKKFVQQLTVSLTLYVLEKFSRKFCLGLFLSSITPLFRPLLREHFPINSYLNISSRVRSVLQPPKV